MKDVNLELAGLLLDMAALAGKSQRGWGYARAAKAVLRLDRQITPLVEANTLRVVPGIGPTTDRIARELVYDGSSAFVERAIAEAGKTEEISVLRGCRHRFLSHAAVREILWKRSAPSREKYRGDFQMHSVWSDGAESLESIADACVARGYTCAGMTDHSYGLPIARGMSMDQVAQQHAAIDQINARHSGRFRMFKGIEANIRPDGTVDMEPQELRLFEFVVASPHSLLRKSVDQTPRMVGAVSQPGAASWDIRRGAASTRGPECRPIGTPCSRSQPAAKVAIEIDGSWDRQDVHYELAARALASGCIFALASDAHAHSELDFVDVAIAHARLASIPQDRIVNYWSERRFLEWARGAWDR